MTDEQLMDEALALAAKGCGHVNPNPMVGAVVVKDRRIIGRGYHEKYGEFHAERNALADCSESTEGGVMYVTLEPCCHYGKTPPCTEAIMESGIVRVVIGCQDPNPLMAGKGAQILRDHGIEVTVGVLAEECRRLNRVFFHYIQEKKPYVVMKYAMTADGKIAAHTGKSRWITGGTARYRVHEDRHRYTAIMVGVQTVIEDDPMLNCRLEQGRGVNPIRIVCDTKLRTPMKSQLVRTAKDIPTIIATSCTDKEKQSAYADAGCRILQVPQAGSHIDLEQLMCTLGQEKVDSILLEGGSTLNWSALQSGIVQRVQVYVAPKILGGIGARSPVGGIGADSPDEAFLLTNREMTILGEDVLMEYEVMKNVHGNH